MLERLSAWLSDQEDRILDEQIMAIDKRIAYKEALLRQLDEQCTDSEFEIEVKHRTIVKLKLNTQSDNG